MMKQIYPFLLACLSFLLVSQYSMGQSFSHKSDKTVSRTRSSSDYKTTVKFADLFNYPDDYSTKARIADSANVTITFTSTNKANLDFYDYYYSTSSGQYFYYIIPAGAYGNDILTVSITYNGSTAEAMVTTVVSPIVCKDDSYTISVGDTSLLNVTSNDALSTYYNKSSLEIIKDAALGTTDITDDFQINYINDVVTPNYSIDTIIYRMADSIGNYDTATVVIDIHYNSYVTEVFDFLPGPGQFVNTTWAQASSANNIVGSTSSGVSLGGFGGYIIAGFNQPIVNRAENAYGVDFTVKGNAFSGWAEPAAVQVMKDENGNGLPDDTWYELAGSEYYFNTSVKNLTMTYYNPKYNGRYTIPYNTDKGINGAMRTNSFHSQSYYPDPYDFDISKDSISYTGTLTKFLLDKSTANYVTAKRLPLFGYADNKPNGSSTTIPNNPYTDSKGNGFDLEWAVDAEGNHVDLDTVHFVKVYSTVQEDGGWLGEVSPEIFEIGITTPDPTYVPEDYYVHAIGAGQLQVLKGTTFQYEGLLFKNGIPQDGTATWSTTVDSVGTIDNTGLFTANKTGATTLTFKVDPTIDSASISIEVVELTSVYIELEGNTSSVDSTSLIKGETIYLEAQAIDSRSSSSHFVYEDYNWTSSNPEVGTINNGLFHGNTEGVTTVIAKSVHYPELADTVVVTVQAIPAIMNVSDTVEIAYENRSGSFTSTDLFSIEGGATIFMESLENANSPLTLSLDQNELNYQLTAGSFGYFPVTFTVEAYNESQEKMIIFKASEPETQNSLVFVNGGQFMDINYPTMLLNYNPSTNETDTVDSYIAGATSVQDMLVDGNYAFVSADYYITRYDMETGIATDSVYTQDVSSTEADGTGTEGAGVNNKMAIYDNLLLATRQFSSAAPEDGYNVRIYNKGDLSLVKKIAVSDQATDIVVAGDTAYVMINGGFAGTTSSLAVIDMTTLTLNREIDLGEDGLGVMQMIVKDTLIYGIRLASFMGSYGSSIITYNIKTGAVNEYEYTAGISYDSSPLAIEPMFGDTIFVKKDLGYVAFNTKDNTFGENKYFEIPSYYTQDLDHIGKGSAYDPENAKFYVAYAYWHGTGVGQIYNSASDSLGSFEGVGASPEVVKIYNLYEGNQTPLAQNEGLTYFVGETEEFEIPVPENMFSDNEDITPEVYLFNPAQYDWLTYGKENKVLTGNYNQQLNDTIVTKVVLQGIDLQGSYVTDTITLNICSFDDAPYAVESIANISDYEYANDSIIELDGLFADVDNAEPFTYQVTVNSDSSVAVATITESELGIDFIATGQTNVTIQAISGGKTASISFVVGVYPEIEVPYAVTDFEDLTLANESYWNGSDNSGGFTSGLADFDNAYNAAWGSWSGWAYSNMSDKKTAGYTNQYSAITGAGFDTVASNGNIYGVAFTPNPLTFADNASHSVEGFYVTNSTYAALSMEQGDYFAKKFGGEDGNDPDYFKLNIWGMSDGVETDTIEFYLADFCFDDNSKDYIIKTWQWVELSELGKVDSLLFSMESSDVGDWGINTPLYFNVDNFYIAPDTAPVVANPIADISAKDNTPDQVIDISSVFTDVDDENVTISLLSNSNPEFATATLSGTELTIDFIAEGITTLIIKGSANNKSAYDTVLVTVIADLAPEVANPIADITVIENAADSAISLVNVFTDTDDDDAAITKSIVNNSNDAIVTVSISGDDLTLSFVSDATGEAEIVVEGLSNGKTVTDTFTVTITPATGIEKISFADMVLYPNPSNGIFRVNTNMNESCTIRIFNMNGRLVYAEENYNNHDEIDISNQPSGQYVISIKHGNSIQTLSIIKD